MTEFTGFPKRQGLYDPSYEKDSCGVGLVAHVRGGASHSIVEDALKVLDRMSHRGAAGADSETGDGSGILLQIPHRLLEISARESRISLPGPGDYAVGMVFLPASAEERQASESLIEASVGEAGCRFMGWRPVPVDTDVPGEQARLTQPAILQFFVARGELAPLDFERTLYTARKRIECAARARRLAITVVSLSTSTLVYKGLLHPAQLPRYYQDLRQAECESAIALVHSRFSTNTFPAWALAHPYRYLCHNGEINTLRGNLNWMRAREGRVRPDWRPVIAPDQSDSACLDNMAEFLVMSGRSLPHAMMMLIPEPWAGNPAMSPDRRAFHEFNATMMEPWDGPAAVLFSDGKIVGATLDRNGLRPCRYQITADDRVVLASEAGVLGSEPSRVVERGRLQPGRMFLLDTAQGRIIDDEELKESMARKRPYRSWLSADRIMIEELRAELQEERPDPRGVSSSLLADPVLLVLAQRIFGYTEEELEKVLAPMAANAEEPVSSMGSDIPLAVLSDRAPLLFHYFQQLFAQVTNPPIDPIREQSVMSLITYIGPKAALLEEAQASCRRIRLEQPVLTNAELRKVRENSDPHFRARTLSILFPASEGASGLEKALDRLESDALEAVRAGVQFLILSDRDAGPDRVPMPSLLALAAVHERLIEESLRTDAGLIVETGEARSVHHLACLIGYGAGAVNPYLALETVTALSREGNLADVLDPEVAQARYLKAVSKGLLKILSKMGISTIQSYCGSQLFEAVGIGEEVMRRCFRRTPSRIGGLGFEEIAEDALRRHSRAESPSMEPALDHGGEVHFRAGGERHRWSPEAISSLQRAARSGEWATYEDFAREVNFERDAPTTIRGLLDFTPCADPIPLGEVEPAREIVRRFTTGAMSLGAISTEAHETLAIAMNRLGGKSNTGEGGEDPARFLKRANGDSANSAIKQVASARFGVTAHYLVNAVELQIKMAQGAKPGEGGQLPGYKVDAQIARLRYATPGVQLISPPPHHDIYSIEDLAQLIHDLKQVNPQAAVSVKLVSEAGVGTIAAGVAKAGADKILISGDSGGTGASPLSSIRHAGLPWELGLSETQQTLVLNGLRGRVKLETDGQLRTGRDAAIAALLGADEFGFATAPLIVQGCLMMRKCHLNTCPVGIATQDPVLRERFRGKPEHLMNYFFFVAEELRRILASLGLRSVGEMIGRADLLKIREPRQGRAGLLDLSRILYRPSGPSQGETLPSIGHRASSPIPTPIPIDELTEKLDRACGPAIDDARRVRVSFPIRNTDRSVGTALSGRIARLYGSQGLPEGTIDLQLTGSAGQSFGAFLSRGITLQLRGEANDYVGKGLSGGLIVVTSAIPSHSILIGNTALYGATSGECFIAGAAGERFAVRNSGARAVVEGVGDHGCEYMTGGLVVVLGSTGRNFAAGMSGGIAYVLDADGEFRSRCNPALVELGPVEGSERSGDQQQLLDLIRAHLRWTGSPRAAAILASWNEALPQFIKVTPIEYKRVLRKAILAQKTERQIAGVEKEVFRA